jgi:predicted nuclease of predicted toxin-antitoxin system
MIIIDENVDQLLIDLLDTRGFDIYLIREHNPGITDREVIEIAKSKEGLIITEDKDFGELVFSYNIKNCSVILLRYDKDDYAEIANNLKKALSDFYDKPVHFFITITRKKIRIKKL